MKTLQSFFVIVLFVLVIRSHQKPLNQKSNLASVDPRPRCGKPGNNTPIPENAWVPWKRRALNYGFLNGTNTTEIKLAMENAIAFLTDGINLEITEAPADADKVDIMVAFAPQDGPRQTLGYAFPPVTSSIFLDSDEKWAIKLIDDNEIDLNWAAIHELGHAIGMKHSDRNDSVMFPYYDASTTLTKEDKEVLKNFYQQRRTTSEPILCNDSRIDDILNVGHSVHYLIKGENVWEITEVGLSSDRIPFGKLYPNYTADIDAAFEVNGVQYFLKNNEYQRYYPGDKLKYHMMIRRGFPNIPDDIDAAFYDYKDRKIYFFKGSRYYTFDITKSPTGRGSIGVVVPEGRKISDDWIGVPDDVEAASIFTNKVWFVKDGKVYVFDLFKKHLDERSPFELRDKIFKCSSSSQ